MAPLASSSPTTVVASTKLPSTNNAVTHPLPSKPAPVISNNSAAASIQPHVSAPESSTNPSPSPATLNPNIRKRKRNDPVPIWAQKRANPRPINRQAPVNIPLPLPPQQPIQHTKTPNGQQKPQVTEPKPNPFIKKPEPKTAVKKIELWEPSITGIKPYDQLTRQVCDFLCEHVAWNDLATLDPNVGQLEVEAKLGKLFDKQTQQLFEMDIGNEAILHPEQNRYIRFESSMSLEQHKQLNFSLNRAHDESRRRDPTREVPRIPLVYRHTRETDSFFESTPAMIATLPPQVQQVIYAHSRQQPRIRVTRGEKGEVLAKIIKVRLMDRHIWNPHSDHISYRISISLEVKYHGDIAGLVEVRENGLLNTRYKDRMTYNHQNYQIDLTQVTKTDHPSTTPRTHELEIEVDVLELVKQGRLLKTNPNESKFERMVEGFVDNMRILGRSVGSQG
ncbi:mRNA triphosphatase CET1 [Patellaria atrata CBS 101060]|uniref:mRNA-capping enzyme subunit beta n=1 Tax=Patellaria atrata CBS 101060 TaxID=1346257 RepID=A0A9P4S6P1_9PEZI|nr:mRNA triphosphatase CET1 [Patellaria atrata CBS 101060]